MHRERPVLTPSPPPIEGRDNHEQIPAATDWPSCRPTRRMQGLPPAALAARYGQAPVAEADVVVALGGDGFLLQTLRETMGTGKLVYGMNRGTVGFLMNEFRDDGLTERIAAAIAETIRPLEMQTVTAGRRDGDGARHQRGRAVAAILPDGEDPDHHRRQGAARRTASATASWWRRPAGSTAYNLSAHGPILPLDAPLLALTPVSPFRPRRWRGALLSDKVDGALRHTGAGQAAGERRRPTTPRSSRWSRSRCASRRRRLRRCCSTPAIPGTSASSPSSSATELRIARSRPRIKR